MSAHLEPSAIDPPVGAASMAVDGQPRARDASASRLEAWFRDHFAVLWRLASRLGVPHANIDDVVQEAFIAADRRAGDITAGSERRFLMSTTVKLCANLRRRKETRREREQCEPPAHETLDAEQLLAQKQLRQWLDVALDTLPLEQRTVFVLHELEGLGIAEMASLLELPAGTVASRLARARAKFSKSAARLRLLWLERDSKGGQP